MRILSLLFSTMCIFISLDTSAQVTTTTITTTTTVTEDDSWDFGAEVQVYPTGIIPGLRAEKYLTRKSSINFRAALQFIDHRDLGVQATEEGSGYGASIAYRYFFNDNRDKFSLALRADYWRNTIDWTNPGSIIFTPDPLEGTTIVDVLQPTIMAEYVINAGSMKIVPSASLGFEWNAVTDGEPTGEGAIVLLGVSFMW